MQNGVGRFPPSPKVGLSGGFGTNADNGFGTAPAHGGPFGSFGTQEAANPKVSPSNLFAAPTSAPNIATLVPEEAVVPDLPQSTLNLFMIVILSLINVFIMSQLK